MTVQAAQTFDIGVDQKLPGANKKIALLVLYRTPVSIAFPQFRRWLDL